MNELRRDYILKERWVIIALNRGKRPNDFAGVQEEKEEQKTCFFCPGNEHLTPPEILRVKGEGGGWKIRCFPNKFPAVVEGKGRYNEGFLTYLIAHGKHEVVVETPTHPGNIAELSPEHLVQVFDIYQNRIDEHHKDPEVEYVSVFKNHRRAGGASLVHTHTQIISMSLLPPVVKAEVEGELEYREENRVDCGFCDVIEKEKDKERCVFEDGHSIALTPYASRFPFEIWLFPKRHVKEWKELNKGEKLSFVSILLKVLKRLKEGLNDPAYNFFIHYSPPGKDLHYHLELCPRLATWAGFELSTGVIINTMPPEIACKYYRGEV